MFLCKKVKNLLFGVKNVGETNLCKKIGVKTKTNIGVKNNPSNKDRVVKLRIRAYPWRFKTLIRKDVNFIQISILKTKKNS